MIFAFTEDGVLEILESAAQACTRYEGVDVDAGAVQFYDADGRPLVARFSAPNRSGRLLGLLPWVEPVFMNSSKERKTATTRSR